MVKIVKNEKMINLSGYEENVEKSKQIDPVLVSIGKLIFLISG